jgi:hypothetical protein
LKGSKKCKCHGGDTLGFKPPPVLVFARCSAPDRAPILIGQGGQRHSGGWVGTGKAIFATGLSGLALAAAIGIVATKF